MRRRDKIQQQEQASLLEKPKLTRRQIRAAREQAQVWLPGMAPKEPSSREILEQVRAGLADFKIRQQARELKRRRKRPFPTPIEKPLTLDL